MKRKFYMIVEEKDVFIALDVLNSLDVSLIEVKRELSKKFNDIWCIKFEGRTKTKDEIETIFEEGNLQYWFI